MNHANGGAGASGANNAQGVPISCSRRLPRRWLLYPETGLKGWHVSGLPARSLEQQRAVDVGKVRWRAETDAERAVPEGDNRLRPAGPCDERAATRGHRRRDAAASKPAAAGAPVQRPIRRSGNRALAAYRAF